MGNRWVSYIYRYKGNRKCENAGYIKVARTSSRGVEEASLDIGIKLIKPIEYCCSVYAIYGGCKLYYIDKFVVPADEKDTIRINKKIPWTNVYTAEAGGLDYEQGASGEYTASEKQEQKPGGIELGVDAFDGLAFQVDDGDTLVGLWVHRDINVAHFIYNQSQGQNDIEQNKERTSWNSIEQSTKQTSPVSVEYNTEQNTEQNISQEMETGKLVNQSFHTMNPIEQLLKTHIKLPQFIDSPFKECVKLVPQDIGLLPISNWKLGQNSFLTHGYYRYKYIMLGKVSFNDKEVYVLGVPGVYTNKEKYLANMFGFSLFIPVKKADVKSGSFGYWVWEVKP